MEITKSEYKEIEYKENMLKSEWDKLTYNQKKDIYEELEDFLLSRYKTYKTAKFNIYELETQDIIYITIKIKMILYK